MRFGTVSALYLGVKTWGTGDVQNITEHKRAKQQLQRCILRSGIISVWLLLSLGFGANLFSSQRPGGTLEFGGTFTDLKPEQKRLVKEWYQQFDQIVGEELNPEVAYGELPYSTRTTFEAVTHASMNTELTDDSGRSLGTWGSAPMAKTTTATGTSTAPTPTVPATRPARWIARRSAPSSPATRSRPATGTTGTRSASPSKG